MKKILASLICTLFLAAPAVAHCGSCGVDKAPKKACCAKKVVKKSCCAKKVAKKSCCDKKVAKQSKCAKKAAAKNCTGCSTASWMMPKAKCGSCAG